MANIQIKGSYPYFLDNDGEPLESGYIFIGTAGLTPESNQITVYYDEGLTQPASQPLRTKGGYMIDQNGSPCAVYTSATDYSLKVADKNNVSIFTVLNLADPAYSEAGSLDGRVTTLEGFVDQDVKNGATPVFGSGTTLGDTIVANSNIEINANGTGDRQSYVDFHSSDSPGDYNSRIIRDSGQNGQWDFNHRGTGNVRFFCSDGGNFIFNDGLYDSDFSVFGTSAGQGFFWDASAASVGINDSTPTYNLDVNGTARFTSGLQATTIDSTNSIDGASIQAGTIPSSALTTRTGDDIVVYIYDKQTTASTTSWTSANIGTRIDTSSGQFNDSNFRFEFKAVLERNGGYACEVLGTIIKSSGSGDVRAILRSFWGDRSGIHSSSGEQGAGTMSASGTGVSIPDNGTFSTQIGSITLTRQHVSNELCFTIGFTGAAGTQANFLADISGTRYFNDTLITSSEGTVL